ncbi:hypothetical protein PINS_up023210 [Pythium insidiosum]|nr:hypothetical protein PINS_up023210 [Pythium insidiosum]
MKLSAVQPTASSTCPRRATTLHRLPRVCISMHSNGFAHRDLSLENVLVTDDNTCKVCDFGLAAVADQPSNETVGKMFYMAPEVLSGSSYDPKKADVWSLGVMLFIMLFGAPPVESAAPTDARFKIISTKGIRHPHWSMGPHGQRPRRSY